jgi:amino acid transporter
MHKTLEIIKNILLTILTLLIIKYITIFHNFVTFGYILFLTLFSLALILTIKDYIKKNKIQKDKTYLIIQIISFSIISFIFIRTLYDKSFLYNSKQYVNEFLLNHPNEIDTLKQYNVLYLYQNMMYFIILLSLTLIYRKINIEKKESKYNSLTLICMLLSVISIIPTLQCLTGDINPIKYLLFTLILIGIEVYRLIKDNHKKREWPIYVSWIFNIFAIISIIVNIIRY